MNNSQNPVARKNDLVVQEVTDEVLVYDLSSNKAHCLNETAAMVWKSCDGSNSVTDIAKLIGSDKGGHISDDLVWLAIDQLSENNLLEKQIESNFAGHSRRDVIKKIGLAAVIGLPIVASLTAPTNVMAATSCNCITSADCPGQSGCGGNTCTTGRCVAPFADQGERPR